MLQVQCYRKETLLYSYGESMGCIFLVDAQHNSRINRAKQQEAGLSQWEAGP